MKIKTQLWLRALIAAVVTGAANAGLATLGVTGVNLAGANIPALDIKQLAVMVFSGGFVGLLAYLKQSPVPPSDDPPASNGGNGTALLLALCLAASVASFSGCASVAPGNDPLVVRVEQVQTTAKASFDLVLNVDNANRSFYRTNAPGFHAFCTWLRTPVPIGDDGVLPRCSALLWTLDAEKLAYKNGMATSNAVTAALTLVIETANQAQLWAQTIKSTTH